jgi:hypothetical protein
VHWEGPCRVRFCVVTSQDIAVRGQRRGAIARTVAACALLGALAGCAAGARAGANSGTAPPSSPPGTSRTASPGAGRTVGGSPGGTPVPTPKPVPALPAALPVGPPSAAALPQTGAFPKTTGTAFANEVHDIWLALSTGDPDYARPAFFPEQAYRQIKAIADPAADWQGRLWYDFTLDLAAAHKLIKPGAALVKVVVPTQYAEWVGVGACSNSLGYWYVPGSRVVYRQDGAAKSFGIASFISWRGDWYLIHLGAEVRGGAYGIVDDPEPGEGVPGPPGGC